MRSVTKRSFFARAFMLLMLGIIGMSYVLPGQPQSGESDWSFNATIIEACSCPNPCPCNFNSAKPAEPIVIKTLYYGGTMASS
jgi:hypothetical protein